MSPPLPPASVPVDQQVRSLCDQGAADEAVRLGLAALPGLSGSARGRLLMALCHSETIRGHFRAALGQAVEACNLFRAGHDAAHMADALVSLAGVLRAAGDHAARSRRWKRARCCCASATSRCACRACCG